MDKAKSYFACFSFFESGEVNEDEINRLTQELEDTKVVYTYHDMYIYIYNIYNKPN